MATYTWNGLNLTQKLSLAWVIASIQTANLGILLLPDASFAVKLIGIAGLNGVIGGFLGLVFGVDWE